MEARLSDYLRPDGTPKNSKQEHTNNKKETPEGFIDNSIVLEEKISEENKKLNFKQGIQEIEVKSPSVHEVYKKTLLFVGDLKLFE